jgi:hypothetical protein
VHRATKASSPKTVKLFAAATPLAMGVVGVPAMDFANAMRGMWEKLALSVPVEVLQMAVRCHATLIQLATGTGDVTGMAIAHAIRDLPVCEHYWKPCSCLLHCSC